MKKKKGKFAPPSKEKSYRYTLSYVREEAKKVQAKLLELLSNRSIEQIEKRKRQYLKQTNNSLRHYTLNYFVKYG